MNRKGMPGHKSFNMHPAFVADIESNKAIKSAYRKQRGEIRALDDAGPSKTKKYSAVRMP